MTNAVAANQTNIVAQQQRLLPQQGAEQIIAANRNAFGFVDTAGIAQDIQALQAVDPAAAEALLKQVEAQLGAGDLGSLYEALGFRPALDATDRITGTGPQLTGQNNGILGSGDVYAFGKKKIGTGASVEVGAGYKATQLRGGFEGAALDTNFGRGTIEPGNANANAFSRLANAGGRLFDTTVGRVLNGFDARLSAEGETSSNAAAKGNLGKGQGVIGVYQEVKGFLRVELTAETPYADFQARGNAETSVAGGIGVAAGTGVAQAAIGPVPVFGKVSAPALNQEARAVATDNWAGTDLIAQMNAAGGPASSPEAQKVHEKFTVSRSGMLSVNFAGSVEFKEGVTANESSGTITAALRGDNASLESQTGRIENVLGGKYVSLDDAARFLQEVGRQNHGGTFEALSEITPEMLASLNSDKIISRTIDGQSVTLVSQENLRLPIFMGANGAEFRSVTEGAQGLTRLTALN